MSSAFSGRRWWAALPAMAIGLLGPMLIGVTPSYAAPAVPCAQPTRDDAQIPVYRRIADTTDVTSVDLAQLPELNPAARSRVASPRLPTSVQIPVYLHVIRGTHKGEKYRFGPRKIRQALGILNRGFDGGQSSLNPPTRYQFVLKHVDYTVRDGWYHAYLMGTRDKRMKRALHRGDAGSLNLYINGGGTPSIPVLGWARFPWQAAAYPRLDSVSINHNALPGGTFTGYNLGDTLIHETGHWMGLLHTFQGGCGTTGDQVADTPSEGEPSYFCESGRNTCPDLPGNDPVRNFMDYSLDQCMFTFSPGQVARMDLAFAEFRR